MSSNGRPHIPRRLKHLELDGHEVQIGNRMMPSPVCNSHPVPLNLARAGRFDCGLEVDHDWLNNQTETELQLAMEAHWVHHHGKHQRAGEWYLGVNRAPGVITIGCDMTKCKVTGLLVPKGAKLT